MNERWTLKTAIEIIEINPNKCAVCPGRAVAVNKFHKGTRCVIFDKWLYPFEMNHRQCYPAELVKHLLEVI